MKKLLYAIVALTLLAGCKQASQNAETDTSDNKKTTLVAYFSASGTTEAVAQLLAQAADADLLQIEPENVYTDNDLNWRDSLSRSSVEMRDTSARPALKSAPADLSQYDKVFIGFPIWWGVAPRIINTFIESANLEGKTIIPFATSGESPIEPATEALRADYPNLNIIDGCLLNDITFEDISNWIEELKK